VAQYTKGQVVRVTAVFRNNAGGIADPSTITFKFLTDSGVADTYVYLTDAELARDTTGTYHVDLTLNEEGVWRYRWESTGNPATAEEGLLGVAASSF
jgi:hypothetical protein